MHLCRSSRNSQFGIWTKVVRKEAPASGDASMPRANPIPNPQRCRAQVAKSGSSLRRYSRFFVDYLSQFSTRKPRMRENSAVLAVTRIAPVA